MPPKKSNSSTTKTAPAVVSKPSYVSAFENITMGMAKTAADKMNEKIRTICEENNVENPEEYLLTMEIVLEWFGMSPPLQEKIKRKAPLKPREIPPDDLRCTANKKAEREGETPQRCTGRRIKGTEYCFSHDPNKPKRVKKTDSKTKDKEEEPEEDEEEEEEEEVIVPPPPKVEKINLEIADEDENVATSSTGAAGRRRRLRQ